ncbi:MAG: AbrB/MazE/SpoVT family DNA-binding domain-containing protein [Candidatus Korarchaeota archaeon]|nr:AbrB/MazE/SpoVT family DNA-binding domain-containing protein [Candidatus Korarchaeota archaeon]
MTDMRRLLRVGRDGSLRLPAELLGAVGARPGSLVSVEVDEVGGVISLRTLSIQRPEMRMGRGLTPEEIGELIVAGARA